MTLLFVVVVASFPPESVQPLLGLSLYLFVTAALGGVGARPLARRILLVLPLVAALGLAGLFTDRAPVVVLGGATVSRGLLRLVSLLVRAVLVTGAAVLLTATTGFDGICAALERLRVPAVLVVQLRLLFRHIETLSDEISAVLTAYRLRMRRARGVAPRHWGAVAGSVLLRSVNRAERVHQAMLARGFGPENARRRGPGFSARDAVYIVGWSLLILGSRMVDIPEVLGGLAERILHG